MINITCPKCATSYTVKDKYAGLTIKCKKCGAGMSVPASASATTDQQSNSLADSPIPSPEPSPTTNIVGIRPVGLLAGGLVVSVILLLLAWQGGYLADSGESTAVRTFRTEKEDDPPDANGILGSGPHCFASVESGSLLRSG
ncbi:MAG: hypothetical protein FJ303_23105 [Planctomycetes bacterium]|nr:hypothetical protein [Planctomycetota bacterium]